MLFFHLLCSLIMVSADETLQLGDYSVDILGRSGKMNFHGPDGSMQITFDHLTEIDSEGALAHNSHRFQNFAQLDFQFGEVRSGTWAGDWNTSVAYESLNYSGTVLGGELTITTILFEERGRILVNDGLEKFDVYPGVMKFSVEIDGWQFCDPCTQGQTDNYGDSLILGIEVKTIGGRRMLQTNSTNNTSIPSRAPSGSPSRTPSRTPSVSPTFAPTLSPVEPLFPLNDGKYMVVSYFVDVDDEIVSMQDGYPAYTNSSDKELFEFHFPKGQSIVYDPIVGLAEDDTPQTTYTPQTTQNPQDDDQSSALGISLCLAFTLTLAAF